MNLSHAYGTPPPEAEAQRLLLSALELGVDFFDTAALYGFGGRLRGVLGVNMPKMVMPFRALVAAKATWPEALEKAASLSRASG